MRAEQEMRTAWLNLKGDKDELVMQREHGG
jgi:hypothetical protein